MATKGHGKGQIYSSGAWFDEDLKTPRNDAAPKYLHFLLPESDLFMWIHGETEGI